MPYHNGGKGENRSTGHIISARLANKPKQKYGLFAKLLLAVLGACYVANNPHKFLTKQTNIARKLIDNLMEP